MKIVKSERRKRPRVDFVIKVVFETKDQVREDLQCENVSMSGLFLRTDAPLPVGTVGTVLIVLESGQDRLEVRCQCKVARVVGKKDGASAGMGLEYVVLDPDSSLTLYNVIKYQGGIEDMEGGV